MSGFRVLLVLFAQLALVSAESQADALQADSECEGSSDNACAVNALQKRGEKLVQQEDQQELLESLTARLDKLERHNQVLETQLKQLGQRNQELEELASDHTPKAAGGDFVFGHPPTVAKSVNTWQGEGKVDSLNGEDQVKVMEWRETNWKIGGVVYQIFVDRFAPPEDGIESKRSLHPPPHVLHNWSDPVKPGVEEPSTKYYTNELEFWGGDLKGVTSKLDYVKQFADIVYLQPIFEAFSVHKYDTSDYLKLDPTYGTLEDFKTMADSIHEKGMKLMLDGVFNHMGVKSPAFQEGLHDPGSKQRKWYFIGPEYGKRGYKTWQNGNSLVELHLEEPSLQDYIWEGNHSVVATWLKRGADGWRLDVGTELGREMLWRLTSAAHRHKYGSHVVGEVSAYPRWWTQALDGVMSFWMGWQIDGFVKQKLPPAAMNANIDRLIRESSMTQVLRSWIIVSNHDLPRLKNVYPDPVVQKLVMTMMFTLPGSPCIYYGEERGMVGAGDPYNRAPMRWDTIYDKGIFNHTQFMVKMRRTHRALRIGDFHHMQANRILAFTRRTDRVDETIIVLANPSIELVEEMVGVPNEDLLEYTEFKDILTGDSVRVHGATITMPVQPKSVRILAMVNEKGNPNGDQYKRLYGHWATFPHVKASLSSGNMMTSEFFENIDETDLAEGRFVPEDRRR